MQVDSEKLKWFCDNHTDSEKDIIEILEKAVIENACTFNDLYYACFEFNKLHDKKLSLIKTIEYFKKMADCGVTGEKAGVYLRGYFIVKYLIK